VEEVFTKSVPRRDGLNIILSYIGRQHSLINEDIEKRVFVEYALKKHSREDYVEDTTE